MAEPCCGISFQTGSRIIALTDIVLSFLTTIFSITGLILTYESIENGSISEPFNDYTPEELKFAKSTALALTIVVGVSFVIEIILCVMLSTGAKSKNIKRCRVWLILRTILLVVSIALSIVNIIRRQYVIIDGVFELVKIYRIFTLYVVYNCIVELRNERMRGRC